jgi:hypothetical protein
MTTQNTVPPFSHAPQMCSDATRSGARDLRQNAAKEGEERLVRVVVVTASRTARTDLPAQIACGAFAGERHNFPQTGAAGASARRGFWARTQISTQSAHPTTLCTSPSQSLKATAPADMINQSGGRGYSTSPAMVNPPSKISNQLRLDQLVEFYRPHQLAQPGVGPRNAARSSVGRCASFNRKCGVGHRSYRNFRQ